MIVQMAADLRGRAPISSTVLAARQRFEARGIESTICAGAFDPVGQADMVSPFTVLNALDANDIAVLHFGTVGFDYIREFAQCDCRKVIFHYGVTDPSCSGEYDRFLGNVFSDALKQLAYVTPHVQYALSVSPWTDLQLERAGSDYSLQRLLPLVELGAPFQGEPDERIEHFKRVQGTKVVASGDLLPNRGYEYVIHGFHRYQCDFDFDAMLCIVGAYRLADQYYCHLLDLASSCRDGSVLFVEDDERLAECMQAADLYISGSYSDDACDGFIGAMRSGTPIVAFDSLSTRGIVGSAGVLLDDRGTLLTARVMHEVMKNEAMRDQLCKKGRARGALFSEQAVDEYVEHIVRMIGED